MADFSIFSSISSKKKAREDEQNIGKPGFQYIDVVTR